MDNNAITTTDTKEHLINAIEKLEQSATPVEINNIVEDLVKKTTGSEYASLWIYDHTRLLLLRKRDDKIATKISVERKKGLLYNCFVTKKSIITNNLTSEKEYQPKIDNPDNIKINAKMMIPLMDDDNFLGVVTAYSSVEQTKKFTRNNLELFNAIVPFISDATQKIKNSCCRDNKSSKSIEQLDTIKECRKHPQSSQEMLDFVANIVHDIRTPSNGLHGFLEILEEQIEDKRFKQYISHAKESAQLISDLTTSILDGVSTRREVAKSQNESLSPFKFFGDIANIFSATMFQKKITYNIYIDPLLPKEIEIDSIKLKRVIMNLIGNANKFTGKNKTIEFSIRYKRQDKKLHIFVKDSGIGIAKEKQEEIFEAFKQAEESTNFKYGGTGLGLAISAGYVKELGGSLCVDSELDKGSTFYFDLPIHVKNEKLKFPPIENKGIEIAVLMKKKKNSFVASHISRYLLKMGVNKIETLSSLGKLSPTTTHIILFERMLSLEVFEYVKRNKLKMLVVEEKFLNLSTSNLDEAVVVSQYEYFADNLYNFINERKRPKVLIVDDDKIGIFLIKSMLQDELCDIDVAYNGKDGLDLLEDSIDNNLPYSLVYSDTKMPIMSGIEMLQKYIEYTKRKNVSRVLMVSTSGEAYKKDDNQESFDIYLGKPFKKKDIKSVFYKSIRK